LETVEIIKKIKSFFNDFSFDRVISR